ncbi:protein HEXIM2 [Galleria mellonella]|uniref:Protein HEXIM2 n=1 Tax=Galleria mellonella TaxID=7137 RepID=A0A6J1X451_GALME|nr:protein HEXIM2 [Galleria mellonella]
MDVNNIITEIKDGEPTRPPLVDAPSMLDMQKPKIDGTVKKKRRRGKSKRKLLLPFMKAPWQDRRKNEKSKRNNRFRKIVLAKTHAPFNNNQFLMEIHKPEPENTFHILHTPSARTRDSSFSVDSEENYFFSLPEDEEEYLTKEFSSVYEDAQSERLSNMSKNELIQEYLLLEAKYDNLVKRTERSRPKCSDNDKESTAADKETMASDKDSMITDRDTSGTSIVSSADEPSIDDVMQRLKEQEEQIHQLTLANEKLQIENEHLRQRSQSTSSEDSESDSSSTSDSCSSSSQCASPVDTQTVNISENIPNGIGQDFEVNGNTEELEPEYPLVNGFHSPNE